MNAKQRFTFLKRYFGKNTILSRSLFLRRPILGKTQKTVNVQVLNEQVTSNLHSTGFFKGKLHFLVVFALIYGLVFINYIDIITNGGTVEGYHMWLVLMYFIPFAILSVINIKNLKLTIGLGLVTSLMNDLFYGVVRNFMGVPYDLGIYFNHWLIPSNAVLFNLNLGFTVIQVQSWMMAFSIYGRFAVVFLFLGGWKYLIPNPYVSTRFSLKWRKIFEPPKKKIQLILPTARKKESIR